MHIKTVRSPSRGQAAAAPARRGRRRSGLRNIYPSARHWIASQRLEPRLDFSAGIDFFFGQLSKLLFSLG